MPRLVIVAGPNRGSSFSLVDGENTIGRQMDNQIVLSSAKVSKRHCVLLVKADEVLLRDETSTNGTFVNGALTRRQELKAGDKIGVGDFVLELTGVQQALQVRPQTSFSGFPASGGLTGVRPRPMPSLSTAQQQADLRQGAVMPEDLPGQLAFHFENKMMPFFYGVLMKNEYRSIVAVLFSLLVGISVVASVMPIQDVATRSIQRDAVNHARVLAREVADRALPAIASHAESQIDLSMLENEETVKIVAIVSPNLQIIAPQSRMNQIFASALEARFAKMMAKNFEQGSEKGGYLVDEQTAVFIEPIKVIDPKKIKNQVAAMAVVSIDFSSSLLQPGEMGVAYGIGLLFAGLAAFFAYCVIVRLSFKPYEVLNEDLDQVLRGELPRVTKEFKIEETEALWNNVNAAVQRIPKNTGSNDFTGMNSGIQPVNWDYEFAPVRALAEAAQQAFIGFDSELNVVAMNSFFDSVTGIHMNALGQTLQQVARDQSFILLVKDLKERVQSSPSRSALDVTEFSGVAYEVIATGAGPTSENGLAMVLRMKG